MAKAKVPPKVEGTDAFREAVSEIYKPPDHEGKRRRILARLENLWGRDTRVISYMGNPGSPFSAIGPDDIGPIASALQKIKHPRRLLFLIDSDGGDAYTAEKVIDVCRAHCSRFIVAVPNRAKSAATLIALGADRIVMGYLSELGPIDPQIRVNVSGQAHYISANSFIEARDLLRKQIDNRQARNEPALPYLQELSGLDVAFVRECERKTGWSKQLAIKYLSRHMLAKPGVTKDRARKKAQAIAHNLSTMHLQHGELIGPESCKRLGLDIQRLRRNEQKWRLIWDYYGRISIWFGLPQDDGRTHVTKVFETTDGTLGTKAPST